MKPLTAADVAGMVRNVYALRHDPEAAHAAEDELHVLVLQKIASDMCVDPRACALQALTTEEIKFDRWCA